MSFDLSIAPKWKGKYPVMDTAHFDDLKMRSALNQHIHRMQPAEADEKAYTDYKHDQIVAAAAHHLTGMAASHAAGNMEAAQKHGMMYGLALHQLGHKDLVSPPDEVKDHAKNTPSSNIGNFRAHRGDAFSLPPRTPDDAPRQPKVLETDVRGAGSTQAKSAA